jgi:pyruvate formate lyase activating enzyme
MNTKEAMFWKKEGSSVKCLLCPRSCLIADGKVGFCGVRKNVDNKLISLVYARPCSINLDPVEKKPLFHFAPGSKTLSVATVGCNLRCMHCQNFEISTAKEIFGEIVEPKELIKFLKKLNSPGFSWTYTEPTVFYEYFYDTAKLCKGEHYNAWVTNGFTAEEPIKKSAGLLDAANVDYKGSDVFYRKICSAWLEPVQNSLKNYKKQGVWLEITNLLIPGHNDSHEQIKEMCNFIISELGDDIPLHFSRYYPMHRMTAPATEAETLEKAAKIAEGAGINYVYTGNIRHGRENTFCPGCKELLIERAGYEITKFAAVRKGKKWHCPACSREIPLAGMHWSPFDKAA